MHACSVVGSSPAALLCALLRGSGDPCGLSQVAWCSGQLGFEATRVSRRGFFLRSSLSFPPQFRTSEKPGNAGGGGGGLRPEAAGVQPPIQQAAAGVAQEQPQQQPQRTAAAVQQQQQQQPSPSSSSPPCIASVTDALRADPQLSQTASYVESGGESRV